MIFQYLGQILVNILPFNIGKKIDIFHHCIIYLHITISHYLTINGVMLLSHSSEEWMAHNFLLKITCF
jgi:hypothetical protein